MNRSRSIVVICMLSSATAHGSTTPAPSISATAHLFTGDDLVINTEALARIATPTNSVMSLLADRSDLAASASTNSDALPPSDSDTTQQRVDPDTHSRPNTWLITLASLGMVVWQLRRKQKLLRFGQTGLARDADYVAH